MTHPLLAALPAGSGPEMIACAVIGSAAGLLVWWVVRVLQSEDIEQDLEWRYDVSRINELRRVSSFYRLFQPAIQLLAGLNRAAFREGLPEMQRQIQTAGLSRFWLAEEYLARIQLIAAMLTPAFVYVLFAMYETLGLFMVPVAVALTAWLMRFALAVRARRRLREIKRRMPFLLDLLTLLMESGSTFLAALRQAVREFEDHPVAEEFGRVLSDMNMGKTRAEAFEAMRQRLSDEEITSIIGSILQGEELGTPLARIFRTQADVLRLKRSQWAETVAAEAGVNMLLPSTLVMMAAALIILGPFLLNILFFGLQL
ncbi:MAG: type II secretion system F family protein [Candidatus Nealsonbacteria bacterium]|nr:type II secretion system F family protein [Candidatus Nealsonbacteria bacterium]